MILYNNTYIDNHAANNGVLYIGSSIVVDSQNFTRNYVTDGQAGTIMISGDNNSINNVNITESAASFGGGGHKFASGVRTRDREVVDNLLKALEEDCRKYKLEINDVE